MSSKYGGEGQVPADTVWRVRLLDHSPDELDEGEKLEMRGDRAEPCTSGCAMHAGAETDERGEEENNRLPGGTRPRGHLFR